MSAKGIPQKGIFCCIHSFPSPQMIGWHFGATREGALDSNWSKKCYRLWI